MSAFAGKGWYLFLNFFRELSLRKRATMHNLYDVQYVISEVKGLFFNFKANPAIECILSRRNWQWTNLEIFFALEQTDGCVLFCNRASALMQDRRLHLASELKDSLHTVFKSLDSDVPVLLLLLFDLSLLPPELILSLVLTVSDRHRRFVF